LFNNPQMALIMLSVNHRVETANYPSRCIVYLVVSSWKQCVFSE